MRSHQSREGTALKDSSLSSTVKILLWLMLVSSNFPRSQNKGGSVEGSSVQKEPVWKVRARMKKNSWQSINFTCKQSIHVEYDYSGDNGAKFGMHHTHRWKKIRKFKQQ